MKCKACNGTGVLVEPIYENDEIGFVDKTYQCYCCRGRGVIERTNEEWLHTLPMEEMADEIISHIAHEIGLARCYNDDDVKEFVEWLKEKHDDLS